MQPSPFMAGVMYALQFTTYILVIVVCVELLFGVK